MSGRGREARGSMMLKKFKKKESLQVSRFVAKAPAAFRKINGGEFGKFGIGILGGIWKVGQGHNSPL